MIKLPVFSVSDFLAENARFLGGNVNKPSIPVGYGSLALFIGKSTVLLLW